MSEENGLTLLEGYQKIEATGLLTIGFETLLDPEFASAPPEDVGAELLRRLLDGDLSEVGPVTSYQITGP